MNNFGECYNFANITKYICHTYRAELFPRLVNKKTGELATQKEINGELDNLEEREFCKKCLEAMEN